MGTLSSLSPGDQVASYRIVRKLGEGGMGVVYEAADVERNRKAALKVLSHWLATGPDRLRFQREIEACAQLTHPNTVHIYDHGETPEGLLYFAMEYLDGCDLRLLVDSDGPQSAPRTIRILDQIAAALGQAHDKGLIHRDIKPPNIILCETEGIPDIAKLVDFGLVIPLRDMGRITLDGTVIGTPRYVAPEMLRTEKVSPATDFYALGLVGYFLLSGRHAFDGESIDVLLKQRDESAVPLTVCAPEAPTDLAKIVHWCIEKDPSARPRSARVLRAALASCADSRLWEEGVAHLWWDGWRRRSSNPPASDTMPSQPGTTIAASPSAKKRFSDKPRA